MKKKLVLRKAFKGLAAICVFLAAGCATTDTVSSRFPQLQENINAAKAADAEVYASAPLKSAEAKLVDAKSAVAYKDMITANRLVDEAMADADYARAMAPTEKAKKAAMKLRDEIQAVRDEIKRMPAAQ